MIENQNKEECDALDALEKEERKYKERKVLIKFLNKIGRRFQE